MTAICHNCNRPMPRNRTQTCHECGRSWSDGIDGCPYCGEGNPFKGIACLTPQASKIATQIKTK